MNYKEKYEDALGWAKAIYPNMSEEDKEDMEVVFPKLAESKDERIKQSIIADIKSRLNNCTHTMDDYYRKQIAWLEKQGGRKPFDYENATIVQKDFAPKVEPKFKIGDWITNKGHSFLIADIDYEQGRYLFEIGGYTHEQLNWEYIKNADEKYHIWSIEDAKDGDVLAFNNNTIVIFKNLYGASSFHSYCHIEDGVFNISQHGIDDLWDAKGFHPATKEQRDILFSKMKDMGYEWDANEKEIN